TLVLGLLLNDRTEIRKTSGADRGFEALTFWMRCMPALSESVAPGPVAARKGRYHVRGRLAQSGGIWGGWHLVGSGLRGLPVGGGSTTGMRSWTMRWLRRPATASWPRPGRRARRGRRQGRAGTRRIALRGLPVAR